MTEISVKKPAFEIEWKLLVFLVLFMDVKLLVKAAALIFIYVSRADFNWGFRWKNSRLPIFYPIVLVIGLLNLFINFNFHKNYILVAAIGILTWTAAILAIHQIKLVVEKTGMEILHNTLLVFFIINMIISFLNLTAIWMEIGFRNPFLYQGNYQKYFINTGDFIKGISFDSSTTNAIINCFGLIYFLDRRHYIMVLACMTTLLATGSNYCNLILLLTLTTIFFVKATMQQKSVIVICSFMWIIFLAEVSPQNDNYLMASVNKYVLKKSEDTSIHKKTIPIRQRPDSLLTPYTRREKIAVLALDSMERIRLQESRLFEPSEEMVSSRRPEIPGDSIHTVKFQWLRDTTRFQRLLLNYVQARKLSPGRIAISSTAGKIQAFRQSVSFLDKHKNKILMGTGMGNFSSKLAFRATGLTIAGAFPERFTYTNPDFLNNHFSLYAFFFSRNAESHSLIHNPASVYDQLITEYGIIGVAAFIFFYLGFFLKYMKILTYGLPLLFLMITFFMIEYWFEQLSIVVLFELMMFMNIKEQNLIHRHETS